MSRSGVVLEAHDLHRHFAVPGSRVAGRRPVVRALEGVELELHEGETLGIVGESGSGKSTLARLLLALDRPTSGEVFWRGENVFAMSKRELRNARRHIQIVMQDPYTSLDPAMTAGQIVAEPYAIHRDNPPRDRRQAVADLFELVGLNPDHVHRYPHQFSGGQRQRIGIARALALRPKVIVCDEPVSALDVSVQAQVVNLLADLQRDLGLSYIFIAHDLSVVEHVSDRIAVMYLGKIVEQGTTDEIYLGATHPYTQALISAVPSDPHKPREREPIVLEGEIPSPIAVPTGCSFRTRCWKATDICRGDIPILEARVASPHPSACHHADIRVR